jgi:hypothetical protein
MCQNAKELIQRVLGTTRSGQEDGFGSSFLDGEQQFRRLICRINGTQNDSNEIAGVLHLHPLVRIAAPQTNDVSSSNA